VRSSRLVALLLLLQAKGRATAPQLARELEVSVRTVYRDVASLLAAGVPLWTEPGRNGGIHLLEGWRTRLDGLTGDEAGALFLSGAPGVAGELGLGALLAAAEVKVLTTLPPELRGRAARIRERFHLDAPGWFQRPEPLPHLALVADAVWSARRVDLRYRGHVRTVDPLGLVVKAGTWYLVVRDGAGTIRTWRVGRIDDATTRDETFERPAAFDLASWWASSSVDFDRSLLRYRCRLRLSPRAVVLLPHLAGVTGGSDAVDGAGAPDGDGWRVVELAAESEAVATEQLAGLGAGVEVLDPPSLRAALHEIGTALATRNAPTS
jgi:predicted DNA-binding transcriptional regulator YafY